MNTGFIDKLRITLGAKEKVTWADDFRCLYRGVIPWTIETASTHKLGEWGEWIEIPFLFIPKYNCDNELVWGRRAYMRIKPNAVSFTEETIDADIQYDTRKHIFKRKLKGGA